MGIWYPIKFGTLGVPNHHVCPSHHSDLVPFILEMAYCEYWFHASCETIPKEAWVEKSTHGFVHDQESFHIVTFLIHHMADILQTINLFII